MMNQNKCLGCGAIKQTTDINRVGYAKSLEHDYCYDCFQLKNYGKSLNHYHPTSYSEIKEKSLIFIIQSVMQLDLLFTQPITRIQPNAKYVYIINQMDLLPMDTNLDYLHEQILLSAKKNKVKYQDIIFMSAINKEDIFNLKLYITDQKEKDIYLFGFQNSGKTTILKALTDNDKVLSMNKAGLTQEIMIERFEDKFLYDMPGTYVEGYLADFFSYEEYGKMLSKKNLKPKIYQIKKSQKIMINDFIEVSIKVNEAVSLVFFQNDYNKITKLNYHNISDYLRKDFAYVSKSFVVNEKKMQITIADLLFIHVIGNCNITVKLPKKMHLTSMETLMK